jgi:hypothetical protein
MSNRLAMELLAEGRFLPELDSQPPQSPARCVSVEELAAIHCPGTSAFGIGAVHDGWDDGVLCHVSVERSR